MRFEYVASTAIVDRLPRIGGPAETTFSIRDTQNGSVIARCATEIGAGLVTNALNEYVIANNPPAKMRAIAVRLARIATRQPATTACALYTALSKAAYSLASDV